MRIAFHDRRHDAAMAGGQRGVLGDGEMEGNLEAVG
jgi:hypothetical protein